MATAMSDLLLLASKKRKDREGADGLKPPLAKPNKTKSEPVTKPPALPAKNRLLAGYLAHEFLTRGTILGSPVGPAGAEPDKPNEVYADVARLVKFDGTHISGVVNPTQLGCWIRKGNV